MVLVVLKTFNILELVAQRNGQPITLTEIAAELKLNQATVANIIKTMVEKEYLEHIGKKKGYQLGPAIRRLTSDAPYGQHLIDAAKEVMEKLTAKLNESSILGAIRNYKRYILHVVNSSHEVQVQVRSDRNVYETASGRLLLAYMSDKELERFIKKNGLPDKMLWKEGATLKGLTAALSNIQQEGLVKTHLPSRHVVGLAVPVYEGEKVVAGLSVFLPEYRNTVAKEKLVIQSLREASQAISTQLEKSE